MTQRPNPRRAPWLNRQRLLAGIVVVPTLAACLYFGLVASDVYESESRFIVRSAEGPQSSVGIGALFKGFSTAGAENIMVVRDYLLSKEVVGAADADLQVRNAYRAGDLLARFPGLLDEDHAEAFYAYFLDRVRLTVDPASSVGVLTVRGFDPDAVHRLNDWMLARATERIDGLNRQIRDDALATAQRELERAQAGLADAEGAVAAYRATAQVLDPERQAGIELQSEQELSGRLVEAEVRLAQVRELAPQSPQLPALAAEVKTLRGALARMEATLTGSADSRAATTERYQALQLQREMAAATVAAAHEAMIRARVEAERRHMYLEVVSAPSLPDGALYPKRLRNVLATFLLSLMAYGVARLLLSGIREHRDA